MPTSCYCCLVTKSCLTLLDPMDCSPPGSSVHELLQARILEWAASSFSRGSSRPRDRTCVSCIGRQIFFFFFLPLSHLGSPCLLDFWFISKDVSQEQSDGRETESKMCGKGRRVHTLSALTPSRNLHNSPSWKLSKTLHSDFSPRLLYMGMIG